MIKINRKMKLTTRIGILLTLVPSMDLNPQIHGKYPQLYLRYIFDGMKRILLIYFLALIALAGCSKESGSIPDVQIPEGPAKITFTTSKGVGESINLVLLQAEVSQAEFDGLEVESILPIDSDRLNCTIQLTKQTATIVGEITMLSCSGNSITELSFSQNSPLVTLDCSDNELTVLNVGMLGKLATLDCYDNKLTELKVDGCGKSLNKITCYNNSIKEEAMASLVNDLPDLTETAPGQLLVQAQNGENVITVEDYEYAKEKNWEVLDMYSNPVNPYNIDFTQAEDLSNKYANCFIISEGGSYKFKYDKHVGDFSAHVLWETYGTDENIDRGDLIKCAQYKNGYIAFQTADTYREGNAVIALKYRNSIIWSWHLWLTDEPLEQTYYNGSILMDRNLGATSNTPGDVGFLGLYYQWGRKDPFLSYASISGKVPVKSTITWPKPVDEQRDINFALQNPTIFIARNEWMKGATISSDNQVRWTTSNLVKSDFDPCPDGWRVPDGGKDGVWAKSSGIEDVVDASGVVVVKTAYDDKTHCVNFTNVMGNEAIYYPLAGYIDYYNTGLDEKIFVWEFGKEGGCWSATTMIHILGSTYWPEDRYMASYGKEAYFVSFGKSGRCAPGLNDSRGSAYSVRCSKDYHTGN